MKIIRKLNGFGLSNGPVVLAAGFFDGVHRGHVSILDYAVERARSLGGEAWVLTFDIHPLKVLQPQIAPLMLTSTRHKLSLIKQRGVRGALLLPFSEELAARPPADFAKELFAGIPGLAEIVVGENWHFGSGGSGTPELLRSLSIGGKPQVTALPPVLDGGEPVSSTRIRKAVTQGELAHAAAMLGRPYSVLGTVVHGRAIGRKLGFPSANIDPHNEALPPMGVYAARANVRGEIYDGVINFGNRPSFCKGKVMPPTLELHLMNFSGNLYDEDIEASFIAHIRDEWYFPSTDELIERIKEDIRQARHILANSNNSPS